MKSIFKKVCCACIGMIFAYVITITSQTTACDIADDSSNINNVQQPTASILSAWNGSSEGLENKEQNAPQKQEITITFQDVAGISEEKKDIDEIIDFLKNPKKFLDVGARMPKGVILTGPPGTGKTLIAKAIAGEAGVPFFSASGSEFVEMYVGVGALRVRNLFNSAKINAPCIIFIDEIDAIGAIRTGHKNEEWNQTLNQLLVEMDGLQGNKGIIVIGATNRIDILDPALVRSGRFDKKIIIGLPDINGRKDILQIHAKNKPLGNDVDLSEIARDTTGFSGADLENLLNQAALSSAKKNKKQINAEEIKEATFRIILGSGKKSTIMSSEEKKLTAYHEAGHAIITRIISQNQKVNRISIIPVGKLGGYTSFREEDKMYMTKSELLRRIKIALAGRAAVELVLGDIDTSASNDLERANKIARDMITKYGMSQNLNNLVFEESNDITYGQHTKDLIDQEVSSIINQSYSEVMELLKLNRDKLDKIAGELLKKETLEEAEFERLFQSA